jgi:hypothetical protein
LISGRSKRFTFSPNAQTGSVRPTQSPIQWVLGPPAMLRPCLKATWPQYHKFWSIYFAEMGRDSAVGIATLSGLDGPGIKTPWEREFPHPSRPTLGPTQSPVKWVPGFFPGDKATGA